MAALPSSGNLFFFCFQAHAKLSNYAVREYESVCPPSCESLDAANLEKRLGELRGQFEERIDSAEDDIQRDQLQVLMPALTFMPTRYRWWLSILPNDVADVCFLVLLACLRVARQEELVEQERILRRSIHDERIRKVKLEAVRRALHEKLILENGKYEKLKEAAATAPPTDNEEEKGHSHTLKEWMRLASWDCVTGVVLTHSPIVWLVFLSSLRSQ